jgi:hypothetical protein
VGNVHDRVHVPGAGRQWLRRHRYGGGAAQAEKEAVTVRPRAATDPEPPPAGMSKQQAATEGGRHRDRDAQCKRPGARPCWLAGKATYRKDPIHTAQLLAAVAWAPASPRRAAHLAYTYKLARLAGADVAAAMRARPACGS